MSTTCEDDADHTDKVERDIDFESMGNNEDVEIHYTGHNETRKKENEENDIGNKEDEHDEEKNLTFDVENNREIIKKDVPKQGNFAFPHDVNKAENGAGNAASTASVADTTSVTSVVTEKIAGVNSISKSFTDGSNVAGEISTNERLKETESFDDNP